MKRKSTCALCTNSHCDICSSSCFHIWLHRSWLNWIFRIALIAKWENKEQTVNEEEAWESFATLFGEHMHSTYENGYIVMVNCRSLWKIILWNGSACSRCKCSYIVTLSTSVNFGAAAAAVVAASANAQGIDINVYIFLESFRRKQFKRVTVD